MRSRDKFVAEIVRIEQALKITNSKKLKNDYEKALRRMRRELAEYDRYRDNITPGGNKNEC